MIYILPISHDVQFGKHSYLSSKFYLELSRLVKKHSISVICEEASQDDLLSKLNIPIAKKIALNSKIDYVPCDLGDKERELVGIPPAELLADKIYWIRVSLVLEAQKTGRFPQEKFDEFRAEMGSYEEIRELHWFEIIKDFKDNNVLLITGAGHISSFRSSRGYGIDTLFNEYGWKFIILPMDFVAYD